MATAKASKAYDSNIMRVQVSPGLQGNNKMIYDIKALKASENNDWPDNMVEMDDAEICQSKLFYNVPKKIEYKKFNITNDNNNTDNVTLILFHLDKTSGIALELPFWTAKSKWYRFGCCHEYVELSQEECQSRGIDHFGMCYHVKECKNCKQIYSCDSSD